MAGISASVARRIVHGSVAIVADGRGMDVQKYISYFCRINMKNFRRRVHGKGTLSVQCTNDCLAAQIKQIGDMGTAMIHVGLGTRLSSNLPKSS